MQYIGGKYYALLSESFTKDTFRRMHVLRDLQPYTCTFSSCTHSNQTYATRHEWFNHETQNHRKQWLCNVCQQNFKSRPAFVHHIESNHPGLYSVHQLPALVDMCVRPIDRYAAEQCPLCLKENQHLRSHLARHMRTLALFVLPRADGKIEQDVDSNGVQVGASEDPEDVERDELSESDTMSIVSAEVMNEIPHLKDDEGEEESEAKREYSEGPSIFDIIEDYTLEDNKGSWNVKEELIEETKRDLGDDVAETIWSSLGTVFDFDPVLQKSSRLPAFLCQTKDGKLYLNHVRPNHVSELTRLFFNETEIHRRFEELQWLERCRMADGHSSSGAFLISALEDDMEIRKRDRYPNVSPWARNRIHLSVPEGQSDDINASPILLVETKTGEKYHCIATQVLILMLFQCQVHMKVMV